MSPSVTSSSFLNLPPWPRLLDGSEISLGTAPFLLPFTTHTLHPARTCDQADSNSISATLASNHPPYTPPTYTDLQHIRPHLPHRHPINSQLTPHRSTISRQPLDSFSSCPPHTDKTALPRRITSSSCSARRSSRMECWCRWNRGRDSACQARRVGRLRGRRGQGRRGRGSALLGGGLGARWWWLACSGRNCLDLVGWGDSWWGADGRLIVKGRMDGWGVWLYSCCCCSLQDRSGVWLQGDEGVAYT